MQVRNRLRVLVLIALCIYPGIAGADILIPASDESPVYLSLELITGFEYQTADRFGLSLWGGAGGLIGFFGGIAGVEAGVEGRYYFPGTSRPWNAGIYCGLAYMYSEDTKAFGGLTPGIKLTHVVQINRILVAEPYISVSYPLILYQQEESNWDQNPVFTLGLRLGIRYLLESRSHTD